MLRNKIAGHVLMEGAGGEGGAGGSGGAGEGGAGAIPKEVQEFVTKTVNNAVTSQLKRFESRIPTVDSLKEGLGIGALMEKIETLGKGTGAGGPGGDGKGTGGTGGAGGGAQLDEATQRELAKMKADNDSLKKRLDEEAKAREEERSARARQEERSALTEALRKAGIPDGRLGGAVSYLFLDQKKIVRDKEGNITWPVKRDGYEDPLSIEQGVAEWLKTDEGKAYLPPVDATGSGSRGGPPPKPGDKMTREQASVVLSKFILE